MNKLVFKVWGKVCAGVALVLSIPVILWIAVVMLINRVCMSRDSYARHSAKNDIVTQGLKDISARLKAMGETV